jgi:hypothetical protein
MRIYGFGFDLGLVEWKIIWKREDEWRQSSKVKKTELNQGKKVWLWIYVEFYVEIENKISGMQIGYKIFMYE